MNRDRAGGDVDCGCRACEGAGKGYKGAGGDLSEQEKIQGAKERWKRAGEDTRKQKERCKGCIHRAAPGRLTRGCRAAGARHHRMLPPDPARRRAPHSASDARRLDYVLFLHHNAAACDSTRRRTHYARIRHSSLDYVLFINAVKDPARQSRLSMSLRALARALGFRKHPAAPSLAFATVLSMCPNNHVWCAASRIGQCNSMLDNTFRLSSSSRHSLSSSPRSSTSPTCYKQ
jgi:hypothetical protein